MKRMAVVLAAVAGIIAVCAYSLYKVGNIRNSIGSYAGAVFTAIELRDSEAAVTGVRELSSYWGRQESALIMYVRHAEVDEVSRLISRLEPLARFEAYSDLSAELSVLEWQMSHIWESEKPRIRNIL